MVWPNSSLIRWAWMRTLTSSPPPAANGTISVIGWTGHSCAKDAPASAITGMKAVNIVLRMLLSWQVSCGSHVEALGDRDRGDHGINSRAHRGADQALWRHR